MASGLAETAKLVSSLELDTRKFDSGVAKAGAGLRKLESTSYKVGQNIGRGLSTAAGNIKKIGIVAGGLAVAGIAASIKAASDLSESVSKAGVVFGVAREKALAFGRGAAQSFGLSNQEALESVASFGNMFNTLGLAQQKSADMSITMAKLAADMASFNNEDPSEMLLRVRSGLAGEAEPLRRFGVLLSEARVQQEAVAMGLVKINKNGKMPKLTEGQKVLARYSLILKDTKIQQGDFARTQEGMANQMRIFKAQLTNVGATIGAVLLPQAVKLLQRLNKALVDNMPAIQSFANELPAVFDSLITIVEGLPWGAIKDAMIAMGTGAKALLTAFTSLPSWVQTAVLTGWGLNKLTGGMLTDIFGTLASGLIKGVLGMNAGVVNINAGVVNGGGGPGDLIGTAAKGAPGVLGIGAGALALTVTSLVIAPAAIAALGLAITKAIDPTSERSNQGRAETARARGIPDATNRALIQIGRVLDRPRTVGPAEDNQRKATEKVQTSVEGMKGKIADELNTNKTAIDGAATASKQAGAVVGNAVSGAASRIVSAIRPPTVLTDVRVYVTAAGVSKSVTQQTRYGKANGSDGGGGGDSGVSSSDL